MKNKQNLFLLIFLTTFILTGWMSNLFAQNDGSNDRYNLAVYATGLQNDQPLSNSLLTVVQNKTITKLTGEGNYRLIERSNEFLRQIQNEQTMQQSGEVADGQIAEIGAGLGAQKICVVSITIIDKYLYIATRIVDVATKTSYESGDAEFNSYKSNNVPLLTQLLDKALNNMMAASSRLNVAPVTPTKPVETPKSAKVSDNASSQHEGTQKPTQPIQNVPAQPAARQTSDQISFSQNGNLTVAEVGADFKAYKKWVKSNKGIVLGANSLAYKEYRKWRGNMISGIVLLSIGASLTVYWSIPVIFNWIDGLNDWGLDAIWASSLAIMITGIMQMGVANYHFQKSYQYYLNGNQQTATLQFYPYYGGNNTFGAGLTLRF